MIKTAVKIDIEDVLSIEESLGITKLGAASQYLREQALERMKKYVPKDSGALIDTGTIKDDHIEYETPYAQKMYHGVTRKGKHIKYQGEPQRGAYWDIKMMAFEGDELTADVQDFCDNLQKK